MYQRLHCRDNPRNRFPKIYFCEILRIKAKRWRETPLWLTKLEIKKGGTERNPWHLLKTPKYLPGKSSTRGQSSIFLPRTNATHFFNSPRCWHKCPWSPAEVETASCLVLAKTHDLCHHRFRCYWGRWWFFKNSFWLCEYIFPWWKFLKTFITFLNN